MQKKINSKNNFISKNSGVTIVALSITVIIIIILIAVSVKVIVDEDVIKDSQDATSSYQENQAKDLLLMYLEELKIKSAEKNIHDGDERIKLLKEIDGKNNNEIKVDLLVDGEVNEVTYNGVLAVKVQVGEYNFYVDGNLKII